MVFTQEILKVLKKAKPLANKASLQLYINQVQKLYQDVFGIDINKQGSLRMPGKMGSLKKVEAYFSERNLADTTRANYYSAWLEILKARSEVITAGITKEEIQMQSKILELRNKYKGKYDSIEDGLKSKKQEDSFVSAKTINDKIDEYEKKIKEGSEDKDLLQIWLILKILREYRFRNEIATLEFVNKKTYDNEIPTYEEDHPNYSKDTIKKNMVVMDKKGWFISKNKYKTMKKYGEAITKVEGQMLEDLKFYRSAMGMKGEGKLFKSSFQQQSAKAKADGKERKNTMTPNALSKYLLKWSNKEMPPVINEDGTKKPRNLSTTMIVKVYESAEHGGSKAKISKDSKNRGNKPATMLTTYVSTKEPEV
tara:strand:- start:47 stop:1147 length:1101 start_codon:yes stop_codon:yes gene_type:complete